MDEFMTKVCDGGILHGDGEGRANWPVSLRAAARRQVLTAPSPQALAKELESRDLQLSLVPCVPTLAKLLGTTLLPATHPLGYLQVMYVRRSREGGRVHLGPGSGMEGGRAFQKLLTLGAR